MSQPACAARSQETREIGHVPAAQEQAAAVSRVTNELRDPSNCLRFDLGRHGSQLPGADIRVYSSCQQVPEHTDRSGAGCDVTIEPRMSVEKRVFKQQPGGLPQQCRGVLPFLG